MILILPPTWWRKCYDSLYFTDGETEAEFAHRQLATQVTKLWGAPNPAPVYSPVAGKDSAVCLGEDPCPRAPPPHHHILLGVSVRAGLCRPMGAAGGGAGELDPRWARVLGLQASGPLPGLQVSKYWDKGPGLEANWCRPQGALRGGGGGHADRDPCSGSTQTHLFAGTLPPKAPKHNHTTRPVSPSVPKPTRA